MIEIIGLALFTLLVNMVVIITGFGTSTLMIPVLVLFMRPLAAIFFVSIIDFFGNVWKFTFFRQQVDWSIALIFGFSGVAASILGALLAFKIQDIALNRLIGAFILAYVVFLYINPVFRLAKTKLTAIVGGILYGFSAGLTGIGGPFRTIALLSFDLPKAAYVATHGVIAGLTGIPRVGVYFMQGERLSPLLWYALLVCIPFTFIGAKIGQLVVYTISQRAFRMIILLFLAMIGIKLILLP
jgi:hypothetical protein